MNFTYRITSTDQAKNRIHVEYRQEETGSPVTSYWIRLDADSLSELSQEDLGSKLHEFIVKNAPYALWDSPASSDIVSLEDYVGLTREGTRPDPLPEDLERKERAEFLRERSAAVDSIKVTTQAGNTFDGDEVSQGRMSRAILGMTDEETILWVLADNTVINATKEELYEALRLSGLEQTNLWIPQEG